MVYLEIVLKFVKMTEIQDLNDLYRKLKHKQTQITTSFIYQHIGRHKTLLDLSNKYLFDPCINKLKKLFISNYSSHIPLRYLILQNCLLSSSSASQVLSIFLNFPGRISLSLLDLGNNSIQFTQSLSLLIVKVFEKSGKDYKTLKAQGNIFNDKESLKSLLASNVNFELLNFYDCCLSSGGLLELSDWVSQDLNVNKLDLSYNPQAFVSKSAVFSFGVALGLNTNLTCLKLSGVQSLSKISFLEKFCVGVKKNPYLEKLVLSNIALGDKGLKTLRKKCLGSLNLTHLDLQNSNLTSLGIGKLLKGLPGSLNYLVLAYNQINDDKFLALVGKCLSEEKNLRHLSFSYCFSFQRVDGKALNGFCRGVTENRSLSELFMEGCKIQDDPDEFCKMLSIAIEDRKYPICFKISAVKAGEGTVDYLSKTQERIFKDV